MTNVFVLGKYMKWVYYYTLLDMRFFHVAW